MAKNLIQVCHIVKLELGQYVPSGCIFDIITWCCQVDFNVRK